MFLERPSQTVIRASGLNHHFGEGDARTQVLFDNRLAVGAGQVVVMTGPSGSGKTTLLTLMGAIRAVQEGSLQVLGRELRGLRGAELLALRREIGFIFQSHHLFESLTALDNVRMAANVAGRRAEAHDHAVRLLQRLGVGHRLDHMPAALSGGQRQRVAVARALVTQPRLILADEPTAALDKASSLEVVAMLKEWTQESAGTVVMVTHDNRILDVADRIVHMVDGAIVSDVLIREAVVVCDFLRATEFFSRLSHSELTFIAERMQARSFTRGQVLVRQGDVGEEFFLVREGSVDVAVERDGRTEHAGRLGAGKCFGEKALLTGDVRAATVTAAEDGAVYVLSKQDFMSAIAASPDFRTQLQHLYFGR